MVPIGLVFIIAPFRGGGGLVAAMPVAGVGVMILYVEGWLWWRRIRSQRAREHDSGHAT
jgi:hypothetical protein